LNTLYTFQDGQELESIDITYIRTVSIKDTGISKIVVSMENGQMAKVPWFNVFNTKGELINKYNGARTVSVTPLVNALD